MLRIVGYPWGSEREWNLIGTETVFLRQHVMCDDMYLKSLIFFWQIGPFLIFKHP